MLVGAAEGFLVVCCRRGPAFLHGRAYRRHPLGAPAAPEGSHFDEPAHGVDVMDLARPQGRDEHAPVGVPDHQPLGRELGKGLADGVAGNAQLLGDRRFGQPCARQQQPFSQLQAQLGRDPVRHGGDGHPQPGRRARGRAGGLVHCGGG